VYLPAHDRPHRVDWQVELVRILEAPAHLDVVEPVALQHPLDLPYELSEVDVIRRVDVVRVNSIAGLDRGGINGHLFVTVGPTAPCAPARSRDAARLPEL